MTDFFDNLSKWDEAALLDRIVVWDRWLEAGIAWDAKATKAARDTAIQILMQRLTTMREALKDIADRFDVLDCELTQAERTARDIARTALKETSHAPSS
jgi:hypothetical protein